MCETWFACWWALDVVLVLRLFQVIDRSLELGQNNLHHSFGNLEPWVSNSIWRFSFEDESWMIQLFHTSSHINFCQPKADQSVSWWPPSGIVVAWPFLITELLGAIEVYLGSQPVTWCLSLKPPTHGVRWQCSAWVWYGHTTTFLSECCRRNAQSDSTAPTAFKNVPCAKHKAEARLRKAESTRWRLDVHNNCAVRKCKKTNMFGDVWVFSTPAQMSACSGSSESLKLC